MKFPIALLVICLSAACSSRPAPPAEHMVWHQLGAWSGHGNMQTESFLGEVGALRLRWQTKNPPAAGAGAFHLTVHSAVSGRLMDEAVDTKGAGSGTAYMSDDPHMFYLVIDSTDLDWSVTVEEPVGRTTGPAR